jgi:transposase InsO family protein
MELTGDYFGSLKEPIIIIKHYDPLTNLDHTATRIVRPGIVWSARKRCRNIFIDGIIPALQHHGINPADYPVCFKHWHKHIYECLEERLISDDFRYNRPVVISIDSHSINLTFYPNRAATPVIINYQERRFLQPRDSGVDIIPPAPLLNDYDSPECWQDPAEFWESVDEGYGAVPLPYAWQPYYSDLGSQLTSIQLTESTQPEQSEEGTVTVDASLSRLSSLVSEYNSEDSQNWLFERQYKDTRPPSYFEVRRACSAIDLELDRLAPLDDTEYVVSCSDSDEGSDIEEAFDWIACTNSAHQTDPQQGHALCFSAKIQDPTIEEIGDPSNLNNYLPDSGATQHMTPRREDLYDAVEGQNLGVEVADGYIIHCSTTGKVKISMLDDFGTPLIAELHGCMYVPGLSRRLFSITRFASNGHSATISKNNVTLYFGAQACPVTIPLKNGINIASNVRLVRRPLHPRSNLPHEPRLIPDRPVIRRGENHIKYTNLSLLHDRLGHRAIRTLLAADEHGVWHDTRIRMEPENDCVTCQIATIRTTARNKHSHTPASHPGATVFLDILPCKSSPGITPRTTHSHCLILVDSFSRFSLIYGLSNKTTETVVETLLKYAADYHVADEYGYLDIDRLKADAGSEFTSGAFKQFCAAHRINLSLAAPKRQENNHLAERSWQTIHRMARSMLVHARLPDQFHFHAIRYAASVFNILPVKNLYNTEGDIASPHELFTGLKPLISNYRVFGCPVVAKRWVVSIDGRETVHCTEKGIRGIFIGFPPNQKGHLIFLPGSRTIAVSGDVMFDETFYSAIATTWRRFADGIALQPERSALPGPNTTLENTGDLSDHIQAQGDDFFAAHHDSPEVAQEPPHNDDNDVIPLVIDDGQPINTRPQRTRRPPRRV